MSSQFKKMRLTLGALMEIEEGLGISGLSGLSEKMANPTTNDLIVILSALLKGGGVAFTREQLKSSSFNINDAVEAISKTFSEAFQAEGDTSLEKPGR